MTAGAPKVIIVICSDRTIQASLRMVVDDAGCQAAFAASVAEAQRLLERITAVLILADPICAAEATATLTGSCPVAEFPLRTSSTGVRRMAKRNDAGVNWLTKLVEAQCANKPDQ